MAPPNPTCLETDGGDKNGVAVNNKPYRFFSKSFPDMWDSVTFQEYDGALESSAWSTIKNIYMSTRMKTCGTQGGGAFAADVGEPDYDVTLDNLLVYRDQPNMDA